MVETDDEIRYLVDSILDEEIPDYQQASLAMAIYFEYVCTRDTVLLKK